ncbi:hypothetical protein [Kribbella sancticallisti]|uniref:hypothetical protein n=1 Tax=Kribbella sancticallisti TaxID=460087 RepID=UPI0031D7DEAA
MSESSTTGGRDLAAGPASGDTEEQDAPVSPDPKPPATGAEPPDDPPQGFEPV